MLKEDVAGEQPGVSILARVGSKRPSASHVSGAVEMLDRRCAHSPDGKEIVFIGAAQEADIESGAQPYILDLATRKSRRLDPQAPIGRLDFQLGIPLALTPDGRGVLMLGREQNSFELIRVERNGRPGHSRVLSFSNGRPPFYADAAPDGSIYVDSAEMSPSISRFTVEEQTHCGIGDTCPCLTTWRWP